MLFIMAFILTIVFYIAIKKMDNTKFLLKSAGISLMAIALVACGSPDGSLSSNSNENDSPELSQEVNSEQDEGKQGSKEEKTSNSESLNGMEVHFIDVGQADAALIQYDNYNILIDAGDWQGSEVVPYLKGKGVSKLDLLVGSHPHADHIGQFDKVFDEFDVEEVWMSGGTNTSQLFERVLTAIEVSDASYEEPRTGDTYAIGDLDIEILSPTSLTGDLNDDSIVMKLSYGDVSFLFTGDAEKGAESSMVNSGQDLSATVLKSGHHGSDTSNTQAFVDKVDPEVAVISAAGKNKYNHPNKSVVDRFNGMGVDLYATKTHGNIVIKTDGKTYNVTTDSEGEVIPGDIGEENKSSKESNSATAPKEKSESIKDNKVNSSECVNINKASKDELLQIRHIGDVTADYIISHRKDREFEEVGDLTAIKGIGDKKIQDIKEEGVACVK